MNRDQFLETLDSDIRVISLSSGVSNNAALAEYACRLLEETSEITSMDLGSASMAIGPKRRKMRIDAYGFDDLDNTLYLLAAEADERTGDAKFLKTDADSLFAQMSWFLEVALDDKLRAEIPPYEHAAQFAWSISELWPIVNKVRFLAVTNRTMSDRIRSYEVPQVMDKATQGQIWDEARIHELLQSKTGREDTEVSLKDFGLVSAPLLSAVTQFQGTETYLSILPGLVLAKIFDKYGSRLLEGNVRGFLSVRGTVNRGIRATLLAQPERFLAFNNGITATATGISLDSRGDLEAITNLQIVNGGQTTASLYHFMKQDNDSREKLGRTSVAMKLIVVSPELADELVPDIARYSNSQNKVSETDFFANSPFHRRMEEISRRLLAPAAEGRQISTKWYYERARGSFENERARANSSSALLRRFDDSHPKSQKIDKADLARFHSISGQKPHLARRGSQKNFKAFSEEVGPLWETESGKAQFGDNYYKKIVCTKILYDLTHKAVRNSDWYSQGYLADIVTYGLAKICFEVESKNKSLPWDLVWQNQSAPAPLLEALVRASQLSLQALLDPRRRQQNVTEWAKSEDCWKSVKALPLDFPPELEALLIGKDEVLESKKQERETGKILSEIETLQYLASLPIEYWDALEGNERVRISPAARDALKVAKAGASLTLDKRRASLLIALTKEGLNEGIVPPQVN